MEKIIYLTFFSLFSSLAFPFMDKEVSDNIYYKKSDSGILHSHVTFEYMEIQRFNNSLDWFVAGFYAGILNSFHESVERQKWSLKDFFI